MRPVDYGCNRWCVELRGHLAHRADIAESAERAKDRTIRALRAEISRLKEPPEEPSPEEKYVEFKGRAWILLCVILIVLGGGLIGVFLAAEHLIETTTFVGITG